MKYSRLYNKETKSEEFAIEFEGQWQIVKDNKSTFMSLLNTPSDQVYKFDREVIENFELYQQIIPFKPTAYRDFMLYEKHAIDAARGFVKKYMPNLIRIVKTYEKVFRKPFPKLKPKKRFYQHPIYYMGNHLNFISEGDSIEIPSYTKEMDYELELGVVITKPLKNASIEEVNDAIGGFLILNDFSARDV